MNFGFFSWFASASLTKKNIKYWKHKVHPQRVTIFDFVFILFLFFFTTAVEVMLNVSLFLCVLSAETDSLQTLDNNHDSQQHQQQNNLFPSLDQDRYTRRGGAKTGWKKQKQTKRRQTHSLRRGSHSNHTTLSLWRGLCVFAKGHFSRRATGCLPPAALCSVHRWRRRRQLGL